MNQFKLLGSVCFLMSLGYNLQATTIAYADPTGQGVQSFSGNLALTFTVVSPIMVDDLGVFNASGSGTITGTISVAIYNTGTSALVAGPVTFHGAGGTLTGFDIFKPVTPILLGPGTYAVDAVGFNVSDLNGNLGGGSTGPVLNTGGGLISFTGALYDSNTSQDLPTSCSGCATGASQQKQFDAGTFDFVAAPVTTPEPASFAIVGLGIGLIGLLRRRRTA